MIKKNEYINVKRKLLYRINTLWYTNKKAMSNIHRFSENCPFSIAPQVEGKTSGTTVNTEGHDCRTTRLRGFKKMGNTGWKMPFGDKGQTELHL